MAFGYLLEFYSFIKAMTPLWRRKEFFIVFDKILFSLDQVREKRRIRQLKSYHGIVK